MATTTTTMIGGESWRNATLKGIKLSQTIVQKSDKSSDIGRALDPLPHLRDTIAQLSNDEAKRYTRDVKAVVAKLRESLLETNEEIKILTRGKEALEKSLDHTRKDISVNKSSRDTRTLRPNREKLHDGADDLLSAERAHLLNCKKTLEAQLKSVQEQLQTLDQARRRLFATLQERSRVLDLLCHSVATAGSTEGNRNRSKTTIDGRLSRLDVSNLGASQADPLGPYTPDADVGLADAAEARRRSAYLRQELRECIDRVEQLKQAAHKSVNDGLMGKISETITLKQHLEVGLGENRHAIHRQQRWYDATDKARGYTLGPMAGLDLTAREKLDRPLIRVFQRHTGTQLPEAQQLIRAGDGLLQSMTATSRNIGMLRLTHFSLRDDIRSKSAAAGIDGSITRMRRRKSDHRWTMGSAF